MIPRREKYGKQGEALSVSKCKSADWCKRNVQCKIKTLINNSTASSSCPEFTLNTSGGTCVVMGKCKNKRGGLQSTSLDMTRCNRFAVKNENGEFKCI